MATRNYDDHTTPLSYAKRLAKYIRDPSTIRVRVLEFYGRAPSNEVIKAEIEKSVNKIGFDDRSYMRDADPIADIKIPTLCEAPKAKRKAPPTFGEMVNDIAKRMGMEYFDIAGPRRTREISDVRCVIAAILFERGATLARIAKSMNRKTHSAARNLVERFKERASIDPVLMAHYNGVRKDWGMAGKSILDADFIPASRVNWPSDDKRSSIAI